MIILGIESSCDETGVGIIDWQSPHNFRVLANELASSVNLQARFGGVVPEIASRAHLEAIQPTMERALQAAHITKPDAICVTIGPGLAGALIIGVTAAKAWAKAWDIPWYGLNHLVGHLAVDTVENGKLDPSIALLISGGHTQILQVASLSQPVNELGSTLDDAVGEAFDKVARLLGLPYPGGPAIDKLAQSGNPQAIRFPRGLTGSNYSKYDFSFSGLKSAVARYLTQEMLGKHQINTADVAASFQEAVADVLSQKTVAAAAELGYSQIILGGGASANSRIRELTTSRAKAENIKVRYPSPALCTDNGLMIAVLGGHLISQGIPPTNDTASPLPNLTVNTSFVSA